MAHRPEQILQLRIIHYLRAIGATVGKTKTVGVANKYGVRFKDPYVFLGFPDLTVFFKNKLYFIEVKAPGNSQSPHQKDFQALCQSAGVPYVLAYSVDDIIREGII